ncbi:Sorting nexin lst-4 [Caenorhabditis elegans]|uniref:Isoform a of Sorting nexin lst-4 n=1 Tax=Caenorhabditis elegans TaxID=6239 RepID=Q8I4E2-2|nr:Sorting nexin lst-4 [Caenorhabditis elegans]CAA19486.1 Sorting nexin lst-4 [Caenorhabditis elegans]|eukprot:NP_502694.1 Sorting nexin lst-4 [Caenorhabditis elegans]
MAQVKAEYDFQSQPNTGELSISAGEVLTVIRENIDGGWIEGRNVRGSVGLFPESYVTPYQASRPPPVLPPPLPPTSSGPPAASSRPFDDWGGASEVAAPPSYGAQHHHQPTPSVPEVTRSSYPSQNDDFDDEWTDEDDEQVFLKFYFNFLIVQFLSVLFIPSNS